MRNLFYGLKLLRSCFHSKYLDTVQVARVLWVANGGPAQRSGIKVGDKVSPPTWIHLPQTPFPFGVSERATWGAKNFKAVGAADDLPFHFNLEIEGRKRERERERKLLSSSPLDAKAVYFPWKVRPHYAYSSIGSVLWTMSGFVTNTDSWYGHKMCQKRSLV